LEENFGAPIITKTRENKKRETRKTKMSDDLFSE